MPADVEEEARREADQQVLLENIQRMLNLAAGELANPDDLYPAGVGYTNGWLNGWDHSLKPMPVDFTKIVIEPIQRFASESTEQRYLVAKMLEFFSGMVLTQQRHHYRCMVIGKQDAR